MQDTSWGVFKIRAHEVWAGTYGPASRGQYSSVTIIDSGLDSLHRWSGAGDGPDASYVDCLYIAGVASSCYDQMLDPVYRGHGAHMAGTIAGTDNSVGQIGIANSPNLLASINVCGTSPECGLSNVSTALDWAIDETVAGFRPRHIVNMSIGHCTGGSAISTAVTAAWNAGILLVAAAGNTTDDGPGCSPTTLRFPASYSPVIAVGGTLENDHFATPGASESCNAVGQTGGSVSNAGNDLVAPFSASSMWANGQYSFQCGTSISTSVVSGVAALLWTRNPSWSNAQIRNRLESTAQYVGSAAHFGHGRVDPLNALYSYTILSAGIIGPQVVVDSGNTVWNAYVTGGPSSYSYAWGFSTTQGGPFTSIGTSSSVALNIDPSTPYEFWLQLLVTSGPEVSGDEIGVFNETGNPCAPYVCARVPGGGR
ncbi:MAG: S8 family serine peptidase [Gemmatimonadaceae bacterium]